MNNQLPIYELFLNDADGVQIMSIVECPAIQIDFLAFADENIIKQKFSFDDDKHIITGPAMIPELPIFRRDEFGREFYVKFSVDTIRQLTEKFMSDRNTILVNINHDIPTNSCVIIESYFLDKSRGIIPTEFSDLPDGTWIVSMKVNNNEIWDAIKSGKLNGFSVEGKFDTKAEKFSDNEMTIYDWLLSNF